MASKTAPGAAAKANVVTLKVTLRGISPPIWRRLVMPGEMTLRDLHVAIQSAMGWEDYHLHVFEIGGQQFGDPTNTDDVSNEKHPTLNGLLKSGAVRFRYTYDFGDDWEHTIALEKSEAAVEGPTYPVCIAGKRNCPPEDCGGIWGYAELLAALGDSAHPRHREMIEWAGEEFDPNAFDLAAVNGVLAARFRRS